eukprot:jgi/Mesvir1/4646/Mv03462-RA.1
MQSASRTLLGRCSSIGRKLVSTAVVQASHPLYLETGMVAPAYTIASDYPRWNFRSLSTKNSNTAPPHVSKVADAATDSTHSDFKPVFKGPESVKGVREQIEEDVRSNRVMVYMKGVPTAPMCGFSNLVVKILDHYGVPYGSRNVLEDPALRQGIKDFTNWPTIPQVFVDGEFIGGSDILMGLHQEGELEKMLKDPTTPSTAKQAGG